MHPAFSSGSYKTHHLTVSQLHSFHWEKLCNHNKPKKEREAPEKWPFGSSSLAPVLLLWANLTGQRPRSLERCFCSPNAGILTCPSPDVFHSDTDGPPCSPCTSSSTIESCQYDHLYYLPWKRGTNAVGHSNLSGGISPEIECSCERPAHSDKSSLNQSAACWM